jgi:hypothetical protein
LVGAGQSLTAEIFSGSVEKPSAKIICPRYATEFLENSHLDGLSFNHCQLISEILFLIVGNIVQKN